MAPGAVHANETFAGESPPYFIAGHAERFSPRIFRAKMRSGGPARRRRHQMARITTVNVGNGDITLWGVTGEVVGEKKWSTTHVHGGGGGGLLLNGTGSISHRPVESTRLAAAPAEPSRADRARPDRRRDRRLVSQASAGRQPPQGGGCCRPPNGVRGRVPSQVLRTRRALMAVRAGPLIMREIIEIFADNGGYVNYKLTPADAQHRAVFSLHQIWRVAFGGSRL